MRLVESKETRRILDFDIENRPLSYWYGDVTTGEITAIAWSYLDPGNVEYRALGETTLEGMLADFVDAYNNADLVTGHYIRRHDLPTINAALFEVGLPLLSSKMVQDTCVDAARFRNFPKNQETLAAVLGIEAPKVGMNTLKWRSANRLTTDGIELTKERVIGDVIQHIALREAMLERGMLKPPSEWHPIPGGKIYVEE